MRTGAERTDHLRTIKGANGQLVCAPDGILAGYRLGSWDDVLLCQDCIATLLRLKEQQHAEQHAGKVVIERIQSVYFIGSDDGPIKIGVAMSVAKRLAALQTAHHSRLRVLASRPGTAEDERAYHKRFAEYRKSGEWFERCPEIEAEIARLNASPIPDTLNAGGCE